MFLGEHVVLLSRQFLPLSPFCLPCILDNKQCPLSFLIEEYTKNQRKVLDIHKTAVAAFVVFHNQNTWMDVFGTVAFVQGVFRMRNTLSHHKPEDRMPLSVLYGMSFVW